MCKVRKFIPCRNCPNRTKGGPQPGYYYSTLNGAQVVIECDCHKKWLTESKLEATLINSNLVSDFTFDNYCGNKSREDLECLKTVAEYPERFMYKKMIYLYGPNGTQKTSMVQALGKELVKKGYTVQYTLMSDLITNLVNDFSDSQSTKDNKEYFINKCLDCDFLIIDEAFDLKKVSIYASGYQIPYLDTFIRNRFDINKKSILFVSNRHPSEIANVPPQRPGEVQKEGFGISLQNLVERNTKQSLLIFNDVWIDNVNLIDRKGIFK